VLTGGGICQRIVPVGIGRLVVGLVGDLQSALDIPDGQPPVLLAAHLGNLSQGIIMFCTLQPNAREAG
jgi:hypothetical protein